MICDICSDYFKILIRYPSKISVFNSIPISEIRQDIFFFSEFSRDNKLTSMICCIDPPSSLQGHNFREVGERKFCECTFPLKQFKRFLHDFGALEKAETDSVEHLQKISVACFNSFPLTIDILVQSHALIFYNFTFSIFRRRLTPTITFIFIITTFDVRIRIKIFSGKYKE